MPYLLHVLVALRRQGIERVLLAVHHLADQFDVFAKEHAHHLLQLLVVREPIPLGTGGALRNVAHRIHSPVFMALIWRLMGVATASPGGGGASPDGVVVNPSAPVAGSLRARPAKARERSWMIALVTIIVVAVAIRIVMAWTVDGFVGYDARRYHRGALWLIGKAREFGPSVSGPGYHFFVAAIYQLFGVHDGLSVQLVQAVCWGGAVGLMALIGRRLFSPGAGLLAAGYAALYPPFIKCKIYVGSVYYGTEGLYMWLMLLVIWWLIRHDEPPLRHLWVAGLFLGLATLTRGVTLLFPVAIALWWLCGRGVRFRPWVKRVTVLCLGMWLVLMPWMLRNYVVHRAVVPVARYNGFVLFGGNNPASGGQFVDVSSQPEYEAIRAITDHVERDRAYRQAAVTFWRESSPSALLQLAAKKFFLFWTDFGGADNLAYSLMLPFSLLAMWVTCRSSQALILHAFVFYSCFFSLVFFACARMRLPIEPCLILLAGAGVVWFVQRFQRKAIPGLMLAGWVVGHLVMSQYWTVLSDVIDELRPSLV